MARRKYMKDYRIVESLNDHGGIRVDTEYIGKPYFFAAGLEQAKKSRRRLLLLCLAGWIAFLGALIPRSTGMETVYAALPFVFAALPLGLLSSLLLDAREWKEPLERRMADRLEKSFPAQTMALAVLAGLSLIGEGILWLIGGPLLPGDAVFSVCAALVCACGLGCFLQKGRLLTRGA